LLELVKMVVHQFVKGVASGLSGRYSFAAGAHTLYFIQ
jgi:hypothetical protein